jgi:nucleotide-binding universal stress UspA family protein
MMPPRRILFPVDFSERCVGAAHVVRVTANRFQAEVLALHVAQAQEDLAVDALDKLVADELNGCHFVTRQVVIGDPAAEIVRAAKSGAFDLIMMGTHGAGEFRRYLLGSVAAKVLHDAPCPVWTCVYLEKWPRFEQARLEHVLCGVDFGARSKAILQCAVEVAREFGARLTLVHSMPQLHSKALTCDYKKQANAAIVEQLSKVKGGAESLAHIELIEGNASVSLAEAADRLDADMVVIGRTHDPVGKLGSNAYAIITHSPCPVLSI